MTDMFDPWPDLRDVWEVFEVDLANGISADGAVCRVQLMLVDYVRKSLDRLGVNLDDLAVRAVALVVAKAMSTKGGASSQYDREGRLQESEWGTKDWTGATLEEVMGIMGGYDPRLWPSPAIREHVAPPILPHERGYTRL
jgi:hypothetical protein